jgi:hypothetical protein
MPAKGSAERLRDDKLGRHPVTGVYWTSAFAEDDELTCRGALRSPIAPHFASANSVGVLPVTWRNACENAGTLA